MHAALSVTRLIAAEEDFDVNTVTPGVIGFIAWFLIAAIVVFLAFDLVRRVRRTQYREQIRQRLAAEQAGAEQSGTEQAGTEQAGAEESGSEQPGSDHPDSPQVDPKSL